MKAMIPLFVQVTLNDYEYFQVISNDSKLD